MKKIYELRKKVCDYINRNNMLESGNIITAGISGGADSMCLLNILLDLKEIWDIEITAVHVHHGIRGAEADGDMDFVKQFCSSHNVEFRVFYFDIPAIAKERHMSEEEAGRLMRYQALEEVRREKEEKEPLRAAKIAVAHNMDDSSETFLFNLFRGSGINGLTGINPVRGNIIRPVLCLSRSEILDYLDQKGVSYRTDSTNWETAYTRNKIRLKLMPYIKENINSRAGENINRAALMLCEMKHYMDRQLDRALRLYTEDSEGGIFIREGLWGEEDIIVKLTVRNAVEMLAGGLKDITARHIEAVAMLGGNTVSKSVSLPYGIRAVKRYQGVELLKAHKESFAEGKALREEAAEFKLSDIMDGSGRAQILGMSFEVCENNAVDLSEKTYTKWMNCDILLDNLSIRTRQMGDYMIIDSLGRKKKLKDIMIDLKIPREKRDGIILLARGSEVLWLTGYRMSEACKVKNKCERAVRVDFEPEN